MKNVNILSMFRYSSDYRPVRAVIEILRRKKNKNFIKNKEYERKKTPPTHPNLKIIYARDL